MVMNEIKKLSQLDVFAKKKSDKLKYFLFEIEIIKVNIAYV